MTSAAHRGGTTRPDERPDERPAGHPTEHPDRAWLEAPLVTPRPRVVIERVTPSVNSGRFPAKRVVGDTVIVEADVFAEGHDQLAVTLHHRRRGEESFAAVDMEPLGNDRWRARFVVETLGFHEFYVDGCVDEFATWRHGLQKKVAAGLDVSSELAEGAAMVAAVAERARASHAGDDAAMLAQVAREVGGRAPDGRAEGDQHGQDRRLEQALAPALAVAMRRHMDRRLAVTSQPLRLIEVERERARSGAWYEMFPRSAADEPGRHGTLADVIARLPYVARMGFDVLYLPPIHPIGRTHRKGRNNTRVAAPGDVGSPWAIGAAEGGHDAVHPDLGTLDDFDRLVAEAARHGIEIALDIAFQTSPDHPYVTSHPEWFRHRPDGSIQYAENPPKKYEDIYPLHFAGDEWVSLWQELKRVIAFWVGHGVTIFRVDNPHTKPFAFWEWLIHAIRADHPEVVFLSEAFARPKIMRYLAKSGFSQSYTYFTWRNTRAELEAYLTELSQTDVAEYLRPNLFANTPDILHEFLQAGGRTAHQIRFALAATLGASYGIYGPPFELFEAEPVPGTEEYQDSEKYQLRHWSLDHRETLAPLIARVNAIRRENPAFRYFERLRFLPVDHEELIAYWRSTPDESNVIVVVVNLSPHHAHGGWVELPLAELGLDAAQPYQMHDLLSGARYLWHGARNYVRLDPQSAPAHIFLVRRHLRTERDFDYFQ